MPRVLVVSDVRLVREAFATLLGPGQGVSVIGTAALLQASVVVAELGPDVVLLDAMHRSNLGCAKELAGSRATKVVAFGVAETDADIVSLATAGVVGYVREDSTVEDMLAVLRSAMRNELLCSPRAAATLCHHIAVLSRNGGAADLDGMASAALSRRELQIADLIDRGLSNKEIARQLGIQPATVKNHVHNILDKLKVRRRGEAVACLRAALTSGPWNRSAGASAG
jgi:two-component system, NarL family, nitrate/nitrite response regulator NarL